MRETTTSSTSTNDKKKKIVAVLLAGSLGAGMVGVGANWDYVTSIVGNRFEATVADPADVTERDNALLAVTGDAIDKTFDVDVNNDQVVATWNIANIGGFDAQFAANFLTAPSVDQVLAENLEVFYTIEGQPERRAGTLAAPAELTAVTGLSDVLAVGEDVDVTVRISLPDPGTLLTAETTIDEVLEVVADWDVQYITVS